MSAFVKDYSFNNLSRIGEDDCSLGQRRGIQLHAAKLFLQRLLHEAPH